VSADELNIAAEHTIVQKDRPQAQHLTEMGSRVWQEEGILLAFATLSRYHFAENERASVKRKRICSRQETCVTLYATERPLRSAMAGLETCNDSSRQS
jgi:hypothetical protein